MASHAVGHDILQGKEKYWLILLAKVKKTKKKKMGLGIYHPLASLGTAFPPPFGVLSNLLKLS